MSCESCPCQGRKSCPGCPCCQCLKCPCKGDPSCLACHTPEDVSKSLTRAQTQLAAADRLAEAVAFYLSPEAMQRGQSETEQLRAIVATLAAFREVRR